MKNKKKILFITPSLGLGGAEKNLIYLSNNLSKRFNIDFLILQKRKISFQKKIFSKDINLFQYNFRRTLNAFPIILNKIKSKKYKYIFTSSIQLNFYIVIIKLFTNIKFLLVHRESNYPINTEFNLSYIINFFLRLFYFGSDKVIVQNEQIKKQLNRYFFVNKKKIHKVNNLIDLNYIKRKSLEKINIKKKVGEKVLINVAALSVQKNQIEILKALKILKNFNFKYKMFFIGTGNEIIKLKKFIKLNRLKNIYFLGNRSNPYKYLKKSDLFILSSRWEGMPNVLLEAQSLNLKIISSDCKTGPSELKKLGFNIDLYKSGKPIQLVEKIKANFNKKNVKKKNRNNIKMLEKFNKMSISKINKLFL